MASSAQAKPQHLPLWLLALTITTLYSLSHATEMNNFSKFPRQNLVPETSDRNKPQESTTYGDIQFQELNTQQPPYSDDNALRDWQFDQWNKHQFQKHRLKARSRPAQNDQQPYYPRAEEVEEEDGYRNVYNSESNEEYPMTSSAGGRWDPSGFESNSFGWRRREPRGRGKQGMSDTRFLHGGIFHYDLRTEKFNENHPYNRINDGGPYGNGVAGRFDDGSYADRSAGVNGYKDDQYQNRYENQFQGERGEEEP